MAPRGPSSISPRAPPKNGAEALVRALHEGGVDVCFANPGTTEMWLVGALDSLGPDAIRPVLGLHETVVSGAADGYARMARKPACTLLHLGPGLANALANLHNARRANSPVLVIVGDQSTWHHGADSLLETDIESLASTVSSWVRTSDIPGAIRADAIDALKATRRRESNAPATSKGRVATLVVPHDRGWEKPDGPDGAFVALSEVLTVEEAVRVGDPKPIDANKVRGFLAQCAAAVVACSPGKCAFYAAGDATLADDGALDALGKVAAVTGAHVLCENAFARVDRGGTLPHLTRLPYFPKDAAAALEAYEVVVTCDARMPIAMFGYDGQGPSHLLRQTDDDVWEIDCGGDVAGNVKVLLEEVVKIVGENVADAKIAAKAAQRPPPPKMPLDAKLNPVALCAVVACSQPARCIVVDESLTSGGSYWDQSAGCPEFTHVTLTGGAIGFGPPASVGAAVACPDRWVINLQADGSAMYSTQALWTQARESLKVITVVCANRAYQILKIEMAMQRVGPSGPVAKSLTDLTQPAIDWVSVAKGHGVPASTVNTVRELRAALEEAFARSGPTLIEANLAA